MNPERKIGIIDTHDFDALLNSFPPPLYRHSHRVAIYSFIIAEHAIKFLRLCDLTGGKRFSEVVHLGSSCHDLGKLLLLDQDKEYKEHPSIGAYLLKDYKKDLIDEEELQTAVLETVNLHHEQPNGNGFPNKINSSEIPIHVGFCSVANALDHRLTKKDKDTCIDEILESIKRQAGTVFCEIAVECLISAWKCIVKRYGEWDLE